MQTREQQYAITVFGQVTDFKKKHENDAKTLKEYEKMAHELPILVRTAGLAQALTFVESRDNKSHNQLLNDLAATVKQSSGSALTKAAREADLPTYMRLTQQVLSALVWYKRFAQSVLETSSNNAASPAAQNGQ